VTPYASNNPAPPTTLHPALYLLDNGNRGIVPIIIKILISLLGSIVEKAAFQSESGRYDV
jgi:hypothetical protein